MHYLLFYEVVPDYEERRMSLRARPGMPAPCARGELLPVQGVRPIFTVQGVRPIFKSFQSTVQGVRPIFKPFQSTVQGVKQSRGSDRFSSLCPPFDPEDNRLDAVGSPEKQ